MYLPAARAMPTTMDGAHKGTSVLATTNAMALFTSDATPDGMGRAQIASASVADLGFNIYI